MPQTRSDVLAVYQKDMYKATFQVKKDAAKVREIIYKYEPGVTGAGDKETQLLGLGDLDRHTSEGQDIDFEGTAQGWVYYTRNWTYSKGLNLTFEVVEDAKDKIGDFLKRLSASWEKSNQHARETLGAAPFNNGGTLSGHWSFNGSWLDNTDPSGNLMYDSKPLFCLSGNNFTHKGGGTYYNSIAGLTLSASTFEQVYVLHTATNSYDELDRPVEESVDTILTRRGADELMAQRIYSAENLPGGQLNDPNVYRNVAKPVAWAYITDSAFYIGKRQHEGFMFRERMAPTIRYFRNEQNGGYSATYMTRFGIWLKDRPWSRGGGSSAA